MSGESGGGMKAAALGAAAVVLVAALAGLAAYLGIKSRPDSSEGVSPSTSADEAPPPSASARTRSFRIEVHLTTTHGNGLCGDERPFPVLLKTSDGQSAGTADLPVVPGTQNCDYEGTVDNVQPSLFYEIVHNSSGSVAGTVGDEVYGDGVITVEESGGRVYFR